MALKSTSRIDRIKHRTGKKYGHGVLGHFRQLVADSLNENEITVGGPGIIVEIDETKLGKRKYHRGHRVEGVWIIGGVERTPERRLFLSIVEDRSAVSLLVAISKHVKAGSIIYTDLWRAYGGLENMGFTHMTVNHSMTFRDPDTGVCTNTIEGTWAGLKMCIAPRSRNTSCELHLWEFIWRRCHKDDLWNAFIEALKEVEYE